MLVRNDGGRLEAGYKGKAGDCVVRAIAIATEKPYEEIRTGIAPFIARERRGKRKKHRSHPDHGVRKATTRRYMESIGWQWTPTMAIGQGCKVHLKGDELPPGRLVVAVSRHLVAVIDGVIHDLHDPSRDGSRCVYGYYSRAQNASC